MKFVVFGCGSIGRRHIKNLKNLGQEIIAVDPIAENRKWTEDNLGIPTYPDAESAFASTKLDAALVCTPPNSHIALCELALKKNLNVFVEKPLSNSLSGLEKIIKLFTKKGLVVAVGYNLRFCIGVQKVKDILAGGKIGKVLYSRIIAGQYLPDWRPWQNYKDSYTSKKAMGGGVILDGSHELDYARWLFGNVISVTSLSRKLSTLEVETEDSADILLEFAGGQVSNIHIDFIRRDPARSCEIVGELGSIKLLFWDKIELFTAADKKTEILDVKEDVNDMYVAEMKAFIENISNKSAPRVPFSEGEKTLRLALAAKLASEKGKTMKVLI